MSAANRGFGLSLPAELKGLRRTEGQSNYRLLCHRSLAMTISGVGQKCKTATASDACGRLLVGVAAAPLQKHPCTGLGHGPEPGQTQISIYIKKEIPTELSGLLSRKQMLLHVVKKPRRRTRRWKQEAIDKQICFSFRPGWHFHIKRRKKTVPTMDSFASPSQTLAALYQVDTQGTIAPIVPGRFG